MGNGECINVWRERERGREKGKEREEARKGEGKVSFFFVWLVVLRNSFFSLVRLNLSVSNGRQSGCTSVSVSCLPKGRRSEENRKIGLKRESYDVGGREGGESGGRGEVCVCGWVE
jgi:hypothetical protein